MSNDQTLIKNDESNLVFNMRVADEVKRAVGEVKMKSKLTLLKEKSARAQTLLKLEIEDLYDEISFTRWVLVLSTLLNIGFVALLCYLP